MAVERTDHLFMHCQLTQLVWFSSQLSIHVPNCINLNSWLLEWLSGKDKWASQVFCTTLWKIWNARNKLVFEKKAFDPITVATEALEFVLEFSKLNHIPREPPPNAPVLTWYPPNENFLKINVDAGCFSDGFTCFGMLIRNNLGKVLFAACKRLELETSPVLAEALAIRWSLQIAKEQGLLNCIIESDAETVVKCIKREFVVADIDPIIQDCIELLDQLACSSMSHVKRQLNMAAHGLVRLAYQVGSRSWVENAPSQIQEIICKDCALCFA